jgi:hypothetical protein
MKNKNTYPEIALPEFACELCGFTGEETLELHAAEDTLVVLKEQMTAMELIHAIDALGGIASELTVILAKACGFCDNCGDGNSEHCADCDSSKDGPVEWVKDCELCRDLLNGDEAIRVPEYLLEEAGIPKDSKLQAYVDEDSGEITIAEADTQYDIADVPAGIRAVLAQSGVCLAGLDELLMLEKIVYGD